jgi:hypothetical protein
MAFSQQQYISIVNKKKLKQYLCHVLKTMFSLQI